MSGTTNVTLPAIPAPSAGGSPAIFVKGVANNAATVASAQYVTFAHAFQKGELPARSGLAANFGAGAIPAQIDVKTSYDDGSVAHGIVSVEAPSVAAGSTVWGQFSVASAAGTPLSLASGLGTNSLSLTVAPNAPPDWAPGMSVVAGNVNNPVTSTMVMPKDGNAGGYMFQATASITPGDWTAAAAKAVGAVIKPTAGNAGNFVFECTAAGSTGATGPTWPQTVGATITDGGVTWQNIGLVGQTGTTAPTWPQTPGASVTDGVVTWVNAGVNVAASATDLVALVKNAAADLWLSGPLAVQGRAQTTLSPTLRVVVDATAYADGTVSFDVELANDITAVATGGPAVVCPGVALYTATLTLNGAQAYESPALTHYFGENWTWQVGTVPHVTNSVQENILQVIHDPDDFIAAQATQAYDTKMGVAQGSLGSAQTAQTYPGFGEPLTDPTSPTDMTQAVVTHYMPGVGGRPDIGIDDIFVCWWFVTQNPGFRQVAFECAKVNGAIPWHYYNAATGDPVTFDEYPHYYTYIWGGTVWPPTQVPTLLSGDPKFALDPAHFPELVYLQYITTGRRYFLDELNHTAAWAVSTQRDSPGYRNGGQGLFLRQGQQVRGSAWLLRSTNYAVYANPDGSRLKGWFRQVLDNNLYWFLGQIQQYQEIQGPELFGYFPALYPGPLMPNFEECYLLSSFAFAAQIGHPAALQICQWMGNYFTGLLLNGSNNPVKGLPPAQACTYDLQLFPITATHPNDNWSTGNIPAQTWDAYETLVETNADSQVVNGEVVWVYNIPSGGSHGDYAQLVLIGLTCLANLGVANAAEACNVMVTQTAADGTTPSTLTPAALASANQTWHSVLRTLNDSQVIAAPSALAGYGSAYMPALTTSAGAVIAPPVQQPTQADTGEGGVTMPAIVASAAASVPGYAALANALSAVKAALATL